MKISMNGLQRALVFAFLFLGFVSESVAQWTIDSIPQYMTLASKVQLGSKVIMSTGGTWQIYDMENGAKTNGTFSQPRGYITAGGAADRAYFAGGSYGPFTDPVMSNRVDIYNNATNSWSVSTLSQARRVGGVGVAGNKVYFGGGRVVLAYSNKVDIFDAVTNVKTTTTLSQARTGIAVASAGNKIIFAGGETGSIINGQYLTSNRVDIFDVNTGVRTTDTLSNKRYYLTAAAVGNKILFAGGVDDNGFYSNKVDIYDVTTNTRTVAQLSEPKYNMTIAVVGDNVYFAGGTNSNSGSLSNRVEIYNSSTNTWSYATLSSPRMSMVVGITSKQLMFAGGVVTWGNTGTDRVEILDLNSNMWSVEYLSQPRLGLVSGSWGDKAAFIGGAAYWSTYAQYSVLSKRIDLWTEDGLSNFYADNDGDGYGNANLHLRAPSAPAGYVADNQDCDDGNVDVNPGAEEICGSGIDQDCDGLDGFITANFYLTPSCNIANGTTIGVSNETGGVYPYTYSNDGVNFSASPVFNNVSAGVYPMTVKDAEGCTYTENLVVQAPMTLATSYTNVHCTGANDGTATVSVSGGYAPFTYNWASSNITVGTAETVNNLSPGTYKVTVTDDFGCTKVGTNVVITQPNTLLAATIVNMVNPKCSGGYDGSMLAKPSGGVSPYTYAWTNNLPSVASQTGLPAGSYTVSVTDAAGCVKIATAALTDPPLLAIASVNIVPDPANPGKFIVTISASGGTLPYRAYKRCVPPAPGSGCVNSSTGVFNKVPAGSWLFKATDFNYCTVDLVVQVGTLNSVISEDRAEDFLPANLSTAPTWQIFPNPTMGDKVTLRLIPGFDEIGANIDQNFPTEIRVSDALGREVISLKHNFEPDGSLELDLNNLSSGFYYISMRTPEGAVYAKPLVVSRK